MGIFDNRLMHSPKLDTLQFNRRTYPPPNPQRDADTPVDCQHYEERGPHGKVDP